MAAVSRADLLRGGVAFAFVTGFAAQPAAADTVSDADLAWARVGVAAELLALEFYGKAADAFASPNVGKALGRARLNEQAHYQALADVLTAAGQTAAVPGDFDYTFPAKAFGSPDAAARLGMQLETALLGSYLGGVAAIQSSDLRTVFARIAASEAEHLTVFAELVLRQPVGVSFPEVLDLGTASDFLDGYLS